MKNSSPSKRRRPGLTSRSGFKSAASTHDHLM
jgi:hypothetical protein